MLKRLAIIGLLVFGLCGAWSQVPGNGSYQNQRPETSGKKAQAAREPCSCNVQIHETPASEKQESTPKPSGYPWRELYGPANIPNWFLALVGIGAVIAALRTLWAIRKQADIQAAGMQQWIDVETKGVKAVQLHGEPFAAQLQFEAVNNTPYLLTIQRIVTRLSVWPEEEEVFTVSETVRLPPTKESANNAYPFYIGSTTIEQAALLTVNGEITFTDCFGSEQVQWFGGLYEWGDGSFKYLRPIGTTPDRKLWRSERRAEQIERHTRHKPN
jgi:hypothetical protein